MRNNSVIAKFLSEYFKKKPFFLGIIRSKEAEWFYRKAFFKRPVLDFGSGDGFFMRTVFSNQKNSVLPIDVGLEVDKERARIARWRRVYKSVEVFDGRKIPFKDSYFSTIISNCVLEHVEDLDFTIAELYRVLRKNGKAYFSVMVDNFEKNLFGVLLLGRLYTKWQNYKAYHKHLPPKMEWVRKFRRAGFQILESEGYFDRSTTRFYDFAQYLSIPSIFFFRIFRRVDRLYSRLLVRLFSEKVLSLLTRNDKIPYSAYFFVLEKK